MGVGIGHPAPPPDGERESSPRIPLDELVDWGRWKDEELAPDRSLRAPSG